MSKPIVSVVMPVYNGARYLRKAIDSILSQTLADLELILLNDGSTDDSCRILDSCIGDRIRVIHQANKGVAAALNRGLAEARGKYIARMDSDDISLPDRLARQVAFMESHPEVGVCGTGWGYLGRRSGAVIPRTEDKEIRAAQLFWPCIAHPTALMRRELIIEHNLYYNTDFAQAEDYEYWLRFSSCCRMANLPESLLLYRVCGEQATSAHELEVHKWSSLVHREAIARLGIEPSPEDLQLHGSLAGGSILQDVARAEAWLLELAAANESKHVHDPDALRRLFFECWYSYCSRAAELGSWTWTHFSKSPLSDGFEIPVRYCISFLVRYALRQRTRAAYYKVSRLGSLWKAVGLTLPRTGGAS